MSRGAGGRCSRQTPSGQTTVSHRRPSSDLVSMYRRRRWRRAESALARCEASDQRPATGGQQPATGDQQPAASNQQPATSSRRRPRGLRKAEDGRATAAVNGRHRVRVRPSALQAHCQYLAARPITGRRAEGWPCRPQTKPFDLFHAGASAV